MILKALLSIWLSTFETILIEASIPLIILIVKGSDKKYIRYALKIAIAANIITNQTLNIMLLLIGSDVINIAIGEILVILVEYKIYQRCLPSLKNTLLLSVMLNVISFTIGITAF